MSVWGAVLGGLGQAAAGAASSGSSGGGGGFWSSVASGAGSYFSSGKGWGDLLGGAMAGVAGSAAANRQDQQLAQSHEWALALAALKGAEDRATLDLQGQLEDYYLQKGKQRQRTALDTYGQFSVQHRRTPGFTASPAVDVPNKPIVEVPNYGG